MTRIDEKDPKRGARIKHVRRDVLGVSSQQEFAAMISKIAPEKVTRGAVGNWERGLDIKAANAKAICRLAAVNFDWLVFGEGQMGASGSATDEGARQRGKVVSTYDPDEAYQVQPDFPDGKAFILGEWRGEIPGSLPELDLQAGAGEGSVGASIALPAKGTRSSGHMVTNEWLFPDQFLRAEAKASPAHSIVVEIVGDSMVPAYQPGDRAIVDLTQTMLSADAVYMISDGESPPQIKRLQRIPFSNPARVKIISDNPLLENFEAELDRVTIYGRVCGAVSRR